MLMLNKYVPNILFVSSMFMLFISLMSLYNNELILLEFELLSIMEISIIFPLLVDYKGAMFSFLVLFISFNVMMFSIEYMSMDMYINRFTALVLLFVLSMNMLIFIPSLGFLLIGWDGLGITSFILVMYYLNSKSLSAGMITAITNRVGDVMLLMSIAMCMNQCHWNIMNMWYYDFVENNIQIMLIMLAGMTKSAQIPFSSWLPAAMAAPTPVSALVHSSTLVTAGVFLLIRFYSYLSEFMYFNVSLLYISVLTMIMSGLAASVEWDMKKIIALSTLSQLGLMMMGLGLHLPELAYLHMVSHALFKALLFICAGNLIMNFFHSQDLRWMGNISLGLPLTSMCIMLSSLSMVGFPFLSAFYIKDQILELIMYNNWSFSIISLLYISIGVTMFYSFRFCMNLLWMVPMHSSLLFLNEEFNITKSMLFMSMATVMMGSLMLWFYPKDNFMVYMNEFVLLLPLCIIFIGFIFGLMWSLLSLDVKFSTQLINNYMWFMVPLSTQVIMNYSISPMKVYLELVDQSWLEYSGGVMDFISLMFNKIMKIMDWTIMWMVMKMLLIMVMVMNLMVVFI
uniref:NADH-ubiquinone oxidoreductase chain 5 n=1 Tax=Hirudo medicinalis TaxID=6421 RepID=A0A342KB25_HIRME|nr:NADH dehydrogenase subunit 5 [Hirudo medicinalis]